MPFNDDLIYRGSSDEDTYNAGVETNRPTDNSWSSIAEDLALAVPRGIEEAVRGVLELPNVIPGVHYSLPESRLVPGSVDSTVGRIVTGIVEFSAGFIPALGLVSKLGKIQKIGRILDLSTDAQKALKAAGRAKAALGVDIARGAVAGAITDFSLYGGDEERFSNLLVDLGIENEAIAWLAQKGDEGEFEGRVKNVLEGLGIGALADLLMVGFRSIKGLNKARTEKPNAAAREIAAYIDSEISGQEAKDIYNRTRFDIEDRTSRNQGPAHAASYDELPRPYPGAEEFKEFDPDALNPELGAPRPRREPTAEDFREFDPDALNPDPADIENFYASPEGRKYRPEGVENIDLEGLSEKEVDQLFRDSAPSSPEGRWLAGAEDAEILEASVNSAHRGKVHAVQPGSDFEAWAKQFLEDRGNHVVLVEAPPRSIPFAGLAYKDEKVILLNVSSRKALHGVVFHEAIHTMPEKELAEFMKYVQETHPELWAKSRRMYAESALGARPELQGLTGQGMSSEELFEIIKSAEHLDEEAVTNLAEPLGDILYEMYKNPDLLKEVYGAQPGFFRKLWDAIAKFFGGQTSVDKRMQRVLELVKQTDTKDLTGTKGLPRTVKPWLTPDEFLSLAERYKKALDESLPPTRSSNVAGETRTFTQLGVNEDAARGMTREELARAKTDVAQEQQFRRNQREIMQSPEPPEPPATSAAKRNAAIENAKKKGQIPFRVFTSAAIRKKFLQRLDPSLSGQKAAAAAKRIIKQIRQGNARLKDLRRVTTEGAYPHQLPIDPGAFPELLENPRKLLDLFDDEQLQIIGLTGKESNLSNVVAEDDVKFLVRAYEEMFLRPLHKDLRTSTPEGRQLYEGLQILSDLTIGSPELMGVKMAAFARDLKQASHMVARGVLGFRHLMVTYAKEIKTLLDAGLNSDHALAKFRRMSEEYVEIMRNIRMATHYQGQGLRAHRIPSQALGELDDIFKAVSEHGGDKEMLKQLAKRIQIGLEGGSLSGAAAASRMFGMTAGQKTLHVLSEFWIHSILSGAKTIATNIIAPAVVSVYRPLENMVGGALIGNSSIVRRSARELWGLVLAFQDSMKLAGMALKKGEAIGDPRNVLRDDAFVKHGAISSVSLEIDANSPIGHMVDWIGKVVRMPSRVIGAGDTLIKQMNYRATAYGHFMEESLTRGIPDHLRAKYVLDNMDKLIYEGQFYSYDQVERRALAEWHQIMGDKAGDDLAARDAFVADYIGSERGFDDKLSDVAERFLTRANEAAATTPLEPDSLSGRYHQLVNQYPLIRFVTPFVRTPVNLVSFAGKRILAPQVPGIFEYAYRSLKNKLGMELHEEAATKIARLLEHPNPEVRAEAFGRIATGGALVLTMMTFAAQGRITGRGPTDKATRDIMRNAGWQPYSVHVPGVGWVSYLRMDPFATLMGSVADLYDYSRLQPYDLQDEYSTTFAGLIVAMANNFTSKTYLTGIKDVVSALNQPEQSMMRVLQNYASAVVPNTFAQAVELSGDPYMRETHSILERLRSRVPGFADKLPVMRNIFGEPVTRARGFAGGLENNLPEPINDILSMFSPLIYRSVSDDIVNNELSMLQHGFQPPKPVIHNVDLMSHFNDRGQTAWDRWMQLHGQVKVNGRTIRQELRKLIASKEYRALTPLNTTVQESPRIDLIRTVIQRYRVKAKSQMLREFPELRKRISEVRRNRTRLLVNEEVEFRNQRQALPISLPFGLTDVKRTIGGIGQ